MRPEIFDKARQVSIAAAWLPFARGVVGLRWLGILHWAARAFAQVFLLSKAFADPVAGLPPDADSRRSVLFLNQESSS